MEIEVHTGITFIAMLYLGRQPCYAKYSIAQAPGMGINTFFTYAVIIAIRYTWQQSLAAVFVIYYFYSCLSMDYVKGYYTVYLNT